MFKHFQSRTQYEIHNIFSKLDLYLYLNDLKKNECEVEFAVKFIFLSVSSSGCVFHGRFKNWFDVWFLNSNIVDKVLNQK